MMDGSTASLGIGADAIRQLQECVEELRRRYRQQLLAVFLYGSAARGDFIPGRSDLNLLIVLQSVGLDELAAAAGLFQRRSRAGIAPLLLATDELRLAARVFPLEISDIKESGRLLHGTDLLHGIQVGTDDVRAQCRRELHTGLIRLRQDYLGRGDRRQDLGPIMSAGFTCLLSVFRAALRLRGAPVTTTDEAVVRSMTDLHHLDGYLFATLLADRRGSIQLATADRERLFSRLLEEWGRVIALVDVA
jgi:predicted nucleotidyltransferase